MYSKYNEKYINKDLNCLNEHYHILNDNGEIKEDVVTKLYIYLIENMRAFNTIFESRWVYPSQIKKKNTSFANIWGSKEEKEHDIKEIYENGFYFPIITLEKKITIDKENKPYIIEDGNHRIDCIHELIKRGLWPKDKKILIYIIPEYCTFTKKRLSAPDSYNYFTEKYKMPETKQLFILYYYKKRTCIEEFPKGTIIEDGISKMNFDYYPQFYHCATVIIKTLTTTLYKYSRTHEKPIPGIKKYMKAFLEYEDWNKYINIKEMEEL